MAVNGPIAGAAEAAEVLRACLGSHPDHIEVVPTLEDTTVYRARAGDRVVYLKSGSGTAQELWCYSTAGRLGVPGPEILAHDASESVWPEPFLVVSEVPGIAIDELPEADRPGVVEQAAMYVGKLHTVPMQGFGWLRPDGDGALRARDVTAAEWIAGSCEWGLPYLVDRGLIEPAVAADIVAILEGADRMVDLPDAGCLIHGDLGTDHVFADPETLRITGIIDYEPCAADPVFELAVFGHHEPGLMPFLLRGYGVAAEVIDTKLRLYGLIRAIGVARWGHERNLPIPRTMQSITDAVRVLANGDHR